MGPSDAASPIKKTEVSVFKRKPRPARMHGLNVERGRLVFEVTVGHGATDSAVVPRGTARTDGASTPQTPKKKKPAADV